MTQPTGPVGQPRIQKPVHQHSVTSPGNMPLLCQSTSQKPTTSVAVDIHQHSVTGSSEMPVLQPVRLASQLTVTQSVSGISVKPLPTSSAAGAAFQYPDSDFEQQMDFTSPFYPEEEGEVFDWQADIPQQDSDQRIAEEQDYWETVRGVRLYMGWHKVPEFESAASSQDDNPLVGPRNQAASKIFVKLPPDDWLCQKC